MSDPRDDLYSDAMDAATGAYARALRGEVQGEGETPIRHCIASAIKAFNDEYPESGQVRLARPPAPDGNGTTVGAQPAAQLIPSDARTALIAEMAEALEDQINAHARLSAALDLDLRAHLDGTARARAALAKWKEAQ